MVRVRYIIPNKLGTVDVNGGLCDILRQKIGSFGAVNVVESSPEVVHVFGLWTSAYVRRIKRFTDIGVPVVFTSLQGIAPLIDKEGSITCNMSRRANIRSICSRCSSVVACGPEETGLIERISRNAPSVIIPNSTFTSIIDEEHMAEKYSELYVDIYAMNDRKTRKEISDLVKRQTDDVDIARICLQLMYIRTLFIRKCIPHHVLDETSEMLLKSNYDEDVMARVLKALGMLDFSSVCMALLQEESHLTEGFMPVKAKAGKTLDQIQKIIVQ